MADFRIIYDSVNETFDFDICQGSIVEDNGLQTAVMMSLFTDAQALVDDQLPDDSSSRRGWWGNELLSPAAQFGSRRWLLSREKQLDSVLRQLEEYDKEALQWLIDDQVASWVDVIAEHAGNDRWKETIRIYRNANDSSPWEFVWEFERIGRESCQAKFEQAEVTAEIDVPNVSTASGGMFLLASGGTLLLNEV